MRPIETKSEAIDSLPAAAAAGSLEAELELRTGRVPVRIARAEAIARSQLMVSDRVVKITESILETLAENRIRKSIQKAHALNAFRRIFVWPEPTYVSLSLMCFLKWLESSKEASGLILEEDVIELLRDDKKRAVALDFLIETSEGWSDLILAAIRCGYYQLANLLVQKESEQIEAAILGGDALNFLKSLFSNKTHSGKSFVKNTLEFIELAASKANASPVSKNQAALLHSTNLLRLRLKAVVGRLSLFPAEEEEILRGGIRSFVLSSEKGSFPVYALGVLSECTDNKKLTDEIALLSKEKKLPMIPVEKAVSASAAVAEAPAMLPLSAREATDLIFKLYEPQLNALAVINTEDKIVRELVLHAHYDFSMQHKFTVLDLNLASCAIEANHFLALKIILTKEKASCSPREFLVQSRIVDNQAKTWFTKWLILMEMYYQRTKDSGPEKLEIQQRMFKELIHEFYSALQSHPLESSFVILEAELKSLETLGKESPCALWVLRLCWDHLKGNIKDRAALAPTERGLEKYGLTQEALMDIEKIRLKEELEHIVLTGDGDALTHYIKKFPAEAVVAVFVKILMTRISAVDVKTALFLLGPLNQEQCRFLIDYKLDRAGSPSLLEQVSLWSNHGFREGYNREILGYKAFALGLKTDMDVSVLHHLITVLLSRSFAGVKAQADYLLAKFKMSFDQHIFDNFMSFLINSAQLFSTAQEKNAPKEGILLLPLAKGVAYPFLKMYYKANFSGFVNELNKTIMDANSDSKFNVEQFCQDFWRAYLFISSYEPSSAFPDPMLQAMQGSVGLIRDMFNKLLAELIETYRDSRLTKALLKFLRDEDCFSSPELEHLLRSRISPEYTSKELSLTRAIDAKNKAYFGKFLEEFSSESAGLLVAEFKARIDSGRVNELMFIIPLLSVKHYRLIKSYKVGASSSFLIHLFSVSGFSKLTKLYKEQGKATEECIKLAQRDLISLRNLIALLLRHSGDNLEAQVTNLCLEFELVGSSSTKAAIDGYLFSFLIASLKIFSKASALNYMRGDPSSAYPLLNLRYGGNFIKFSETSGKELLVLDADLAFDVDKFSESFWFGYLYFWIYQKNSPGPMQSLDYYRWLLDTISDTPASYSRIRQALVRCLEANRFKLLGDSCIESLLSRLRIVEEKVSDSTSPKKSRRRKKKTPKPKVDSTAAPAPSAVKLSADLDPACTLVAHESVATRLSPSAAIDNEETAERKDSITSYSDNDSDNPDRVQPEILVGDPRPMLARESAEKCEAGAGVARQAVKSSEEDSETQRATQLEELNADLKLLSPETIALEEFKAVRVALSGLIFEWTSELAVEESNEFSRKLQATLLTRKNHLRTVADQFKKTKSSLLSQVLSLEDEPLLISTYQTRYTHLAAKLLEALGRIRSEDQSGFLLEAVYALQVPLPVAGEEADLSAGPMPALAVGAELPSVVAVVPVAKIEAPPAASATAASPASMPATVTALQLVLPPSMPIIQKLKNLLARTVPEFASLLMPGSQLYLPHPLDIDLRMIVSSAIANEKIDEFKERLCLVLQAHGFKVLKRITVRDGSGVLSIKLAASGSGEGYDVENHMSVDLVVYTNPTKTAFNHSSCSASDLNLDSFKLRHDPEFIADISRGIFSIRTRPLADPRMQLSAQIHILKLLSRAWSESRYGKMILDESAHNFLKRITDCVGDLKLLKARDPVLAMALKKWVIEHIVNYQAGINFERRTTILFDFIGFLGIRFVSPYIVKAMVQTILNDFRSYKTADDSLRQFNELLSFYEAHGWSLAQEKTAAIQKVLALHLFYYSSADPLFFSKIALLLNSRIDSEENKAILFSAIKNTLVKYFKHHERNGGRIFERFKALLEDRRCPLIAELGVNALGSVVQEHFNAYGPVANAAYFSRTKTLINLCDTLGVSLIISCGRGFFSVLSLNEEKSRTVFSSPTIIVPRSSLLFVAKREFLEADKEFMQLMQSFQQQQAAMDALLATAGPGFFSLPAPGVPAGASPAAGAGAVAPTQNRSI